MPSFSVRVLLYFALWYALNILYNITNKWALDEVRDYVSKNVASPSSEGSSNALPFTIGCLQFGVGAIYSCTLWIFGLRQTVPHLVELRNFLSRWMIRQRPQAQIPEHSSAVITGLRGTLRIAIHHTLGQLCTIICLSSNSIGYAHVIKAMEPFFSAVASRCIIGQMMDVRVYLSLLPVVGGVILACAGSDEFSWLSFWSGMGANAFFAMRGVVSKEVMDASAPRKDEAIERSSKNGDVERNNDEDKNDELVELINRGNNGELDVPGLATTILPSTLSPANLFGAVTCVSFVISIPLALLFEGSILREIAPHMNIVSLVGLGVEEEKHGHERIFLHIVASGLFHYLNNEVMYICLSNVHPITLAVGNTMKRVFIIMAGVLVFATPVSLQTAIGSMIAIGGVFVYSLMKQWYDQRDKFQETNDAGVGSAKIL
jgi:solute carrier family 35 protein E1